MPIKFNDSISVDAPRNPDAKKDVFSGGKSRPFNSAAEFFAKYPVASRYEGQEVPIRKGSSDIDVYWFVGGVLDSNLKIKTIDVDLSQYYTKAQSDFIFIKSEIDTLQTVTTRSAVTDKNITANGYILGRKSGTNDFQIGSGSAAGFYIWDDTNSSYRLSIDNSGKVNVNGDLTVNGYLKSAQIPVSPFDVVRKSDLDLKADISGQVFTGSISASNLSGNNTGDQDLSPYQVISEKGVANGYASLGTDGRVPSNQLPVGAQVYKGTWNAATNTPSLADGSGVAGWTYRVSTGGTINLGSGNLTFSSGDDVIYNGSVWQRNPASFAVTSVNGETGTVVVTPAKIGLGLVDNTADINKVVSNPTKDALFFKADKTQLDSYQLLSSKSTNLASPDNVKYPTTLAVVNAIPHVMQSVNDIKYNLPHKYVVPLDVSGTYSGALPIGFGKTVVIIGSSTWAGYGVNPEDGLGAKVAADLVASGYTVYNQAISGDNTAGNVARFFSDVKALKPDIVLLANSITNELLANGTGAAYLSFTQNTLLMARECQRIGAKVAVYGPFAWNNYDATSFSMVRSVENFLEKNGIFVISPMNNTLDIDNNGHWWPAFTEDGTHGNKLGVQVQYETIPPDWHLNVLSGRSVDPLDSSYYYWKMNSEGSFQFDLSKTVRAFTLHGFYKGLNSSSETSNAQTLFYITNGTDMVRVTQSGSLLNLIVKGVTTPIASPLKDDTFTSIGLTCTYTGNQQIYRLYADGLIVMTYTAPDIILNFNKVSYMARPDLSYPYVGGCISRPYFSRLTLFPDEVMSLHNKRAIRKGMVLLSDLHEEPTLYLSNKADSLLTVYVTGGAFSRMGLLDDSSLYEFRSNKKNNLDVDSTNTYYPTVTAVNSGLLKKQDVLVSSVNMKTINGGSLLGSGNFDNFVNLTADQIVSGRKYFRAGVNRNMVVANGVSDTNAVSIVGINDANTSFVPIEYRALNHLFSMGSVSVTSVPSLPNDVVRLIDISGKSNLVGGNLYSGTQKVYGDLNVITSFSETGKVAASLSTLLDSTGSTPTVKGFVILNTYNQSDGANARTTTLNPHKDQVGNIALLTPVSGGTIARLEDLSAINLQYVTDRNPNTTSGATFLGNLGVGTNAAFGKFHVKPSTNINVVFSQSSNDATSARIVGVNDANTVLIPIEFSGSRFSFRNGNVAIGKGIADVPLDVVGNIACTGTMTAAGGGFNSSRDIKNIHSFNEETFDALNKIKALHVRKFSYKSGSENKSLGLIIDEIPSDLKEELLTPDNKSVDVYSLHGISLLAHQQSADNLNELTERVKYLENLISQIYG